MFLLIYSLLTSVSAGTIMMINPMNMGLNILMMAMLTALLFAMLHSSWIAFLLFLIYVSGMLVMFAYFIATSPNTTMNMMKPLLFLMPTTIIMFMMIKSMKIPTNILHSNINTFYTTEYGATLIMLALILLLTMIIVVKITSLNKGPLRPFSYV